MGSKGSDRAKEKNDAETHSNSPLNTIPATTTITSNGQNRDSLLHYILQPETISRVITYSKDWVVIQDKFPKVSKS